MTKLWAATCGALMACASSPPAGTVVAVRTGGAEHLVADANDLYWAETSGEGGGIFALSLEMAGASPFKVIDTSARAGAFAVDPDDVYWIYQGETASTSAIVKASRVGGAQVSLATGVGVPDVVCTGGTSVYWTNYESVSAVDRGGGAVQQLAADPFAQALVVHGAHAYWSTVNALRSLEIADPATQTTMVTSHVLAFGVDPTNIYWITGDDNPRLDAPISLLEAPLGGGPTTKLADSTANTNFALPPIQVDETGVYWSNGATITRIAADGTGERVVAAAPAMNEFVLAGESVFFTVPEANDTEIRKAPKQ